MSLSFKVVIPARHASSRLPGKPLLDIGGQPMVAHVWQRAIDSGAEQVIIATDDERIAQAARDFGAEAVMTSADHATGTDRIAEAARLMAWPADTIVVNVQGDEPLLEPSLITQLAMDMASHERAAMTTIATPIHDASELFDPHVVKTVLDDQGYALYFSRAPIPWQRDGFDAKRPVLPEDTPFYRHIGLYAYRESFLQRYASMTPSALERAEALEQLRALSHGEAIHVSITQHPPSHGVDTAEDLERVRRLVAAMAS